MKQTLIAFALLSAFSVHADTSVKAVGLHLVSAHIPQQGMNNFNPGLYVEFTNQITLGAYYNSYRRLTTYVVYTANVLGNLDFSVGLASGYDDRPFQPVVWPSYRLSDNWRIGYIPKISRDTSHVIHLMYRF